MSMSDPISDMLTRIRNAQRVNKERTSTLCSKLNMQILDVLKREGYIENYARREERKGVETLEVTLKYFEGKPVIREIERVSRPGRRTYASIKGLPKHYNGMGISILSTPKGVLSDADARRENVGGEVLCRVF